VALTFDHVTLGQRVLFGTGAAVENAVAAVEELGVRRILLIHDAFAAALADALAERAPVVRRIDEIVQHVPVENAGRATAAAVPADIDAIVTIGGLGDRSGEGGGAEDRRPDRGEQTLYGAYLAAFASAGSGLHHKICHTLGGAFNLPHAETHSIVLPYVTAFNAPFAPDAAECVQDLLGVQNAAAGLNALRAELGAPASLAAIGLKESDIRRAAEPALPAVPPSNPRPVTVSDLEGILRAAWVGKQIT
jgi:alcohol dehydrogenase class IV